MYKFPSLSFDFSNKHDFLKKSNLKNAQKVLNLNKNNLYILNLSKNNLNRYSKISGFWSLEIMTLQKAFFTYKLKKLRKAFYAPYSSNVILYKKSVNLFLYNFMKEGLSSIPYLKYFFVVSSIRNLKIEPLSTFEFFNLENNIFYNIGEFFLIFKKQKKSLSNLWLSLYKVLL